MTRRKSLITRYVSWSFGVKDPSLGEYLMVTSGTFIVAVAVALITIGYFILLWMVPAVVGPISVVFFLVIRAWFMDRDVT